MEQLITFLVEQAMANFDQAFIRGTAVTGGHIQAQPEVIATIRRLTRNVRGKFWIGKTSGGEEGCRERWNNKYKQDGMNRIAIVYESSSQDSALNMEENMIAQFGSQIKKQIGGGDGGWARSNQPYVVYIAWKE